MLLPRRISYLKYEFLEYVYDNPADEGEPSDEFKILEKARECIPINEKTLHTLDILNMFAALGLIILVASFIATSIIFLVSMEM